MAAKLILASGSAVRHRMLTNAGIDHEVVVSQVDETAIKTACRQAGSDVEDAVRRLAVAKAEAVGHLFPDDLILAADQMLDLDGQWFDKPSDHQEVYSHLQRLSGRSHDLVNGTVIWQSGEAVWQHVDRITMTMRTLSDAFITAYVERVGDAALTSVGAYQLEGPGAQLFERTDGDFFSILGLPLLPIMAFLRERGMLTS